MASVGGTTRACKRNISVAINSDIIEVLPA